MFRSERMAMNRFWHIEVNVTPNDQVVSVAHYVDPWYEMSARLAVQPLDYRVEEASVEVLRTPQGKVGATSLKLESLRGAIAYLGVGKRIKMATHEDDSGLQAGLLLECVKALRQARLFVWERYGIDPAEHLDLIRRLMMDSCIYFTTPESLNAVLEPVQLQEMKRWDCLFSRHKYCLMEEASGVDNVTVGWSDSYHEMQIRLAVQGDEVSSLEGAILRAPHDECFGAERTLPLLMGACYTEGAGDWERRLAGPKGCTHLADLAREALTSVSYWRWVRQELTRAQGSQGG